MISKSGKMLHLGAKSETDAKKSMRQFSRIIAQQGYNIKIKCFKIQTITSIFRFKNQNIDLNLLATHKQWEFTPELFPTANRRLDGLHFALTRRGRLICCGGKSILAINGTFFEIWLDLITFLPGLD